MENNYELRETFWSPYEEMKEHIGKKFEVIRKLTIEEIGDLKLQGELFKIKLEDGMEITAWIEEIYKKSLKNDSEIKMNDNLLLLLAFDSMLVELDDQYEGVPAEVGQLIESKVYESYGLEVTSDNKEIAKFKQSLIRDVKEYRDRLIEKLKENN